MKSRNMQPQPHLNNYLVSIYLVQPAVCQSLFWLMEVRDNKV